jgi:hypothetical protein
MKVIKHVYMLAENTIVLTFQGKDILLFKTS